MSQTLSTESTGLGFHVLAPQSRRFACNRCRAQKLRCIHKSPDSTVCARCERAKTECIYTPSKRATKRKDDSDKTKKKEKSASSSPVPKPSDLPPRTSVKPTVQTDCHMSTEPTYSGLISQMDESLNFPPSFSNDPALDLFGLDQAGMPHPSMPFAASPECFDLNAPLSSGPDLNFELSSMLDSHADSPFPMDQTAFHPFSEATPTSSSSITSQQETLNHHRNSSMNPANIMTGEDPMEGVLTRLSTLNVGLYKLLGLCDPDNNTHGFARQKFGQHTQDRDTVSEILRSSQQFIDIIDWLAQSGPTRAASNSPPSSSRSSSVDSGYTSIDGMRKPMNKSMGMNRSPSPALDMQTTYLIIACYIRILRLYSTLLSRILRYLDESRCNSPDGENKALLFDFTTVQLGGVDIQNHGKLQIQILVQSALYMLDNIESKLGVPDLASRHAELSFSGFGGMNDSSSSRYNNLRGGILSSAAAMTALDVAIRQDDLESQEMGKRKIGALREDVSRVHQLLQAS